MGHDEAGRDERPTPEPFEVFYLREYPKVVGLLQGLLRSRLVAEELAQETFLVAYRDWGRISGLDNPRAWVRRVAVNQRGSFLRAYLRQQTRERDSVVRYEDDSIKLADEHAEVWQAVRTLPPSQAQVIALHYYEDYSIAQIAAALGRAPGTIKAQLHHGRRKLARLLGGRDRRQEVAMNIDDRLRAASKALKDGSVTQVDAASRLREIIGHSDQLAHDPAEVLPDQPLEPTERLAPSFPPPAARLRFKPQRLAIAVNLLLVLALGVVLVRGARQGQDTATTLIPPVGTTVTTRAQAITPPAVEPRTRTSVPEVCLETAEWSDQVIALLNRKIRDDRLVQALREYTLASQACRKAASP